MAMLPKCPDCGRDDQRRLMVETESHWIFACVRCKVSQIVSKPNTKARGALDAAAERVRKITDHERAIMSRTKYFT